MRISSSKGRKCQTPSAMRMQKTQRLASSLSTLPILPPPIEKLIDSPIMIMQRKVLACAPTAVLVMTPSGRRMSRTDMRPTKAKVTSGPERTSFEAITLTVRQSVVFTRVPAITAKVPPPAMTHVEHAGRHQARRREEGLHVRNRKRTDRIAAHVEPHEVAPLRVRNVARKKKPPDEEDDVREEPEARNEEHVSFDPDAVEVREDHARERDVHHQGADGRKGLVLQDVEAPEQIPEHDEYRQRHHLGEAVFHDCLPSFC